MDDKFTRYSKLYVLIFLMFLSVPVLFALVIGIFYGFSKLVSSAPVDVIFELFIISIPAAVFSTAYVIFYRRTGKHPLAAIRIFSKLLFIIGLAASVLFLIMDMYSFFRYRGLNISDFYCFSILFLAGNIGALFLIALLQAFTTEKEKDWLEKTRSGDHRSPVKNPIL